MEKAATLELIEICEDLVKIAADQAAEILELRKVSAMRRAISPGIELEKVAAARVPEETVHQFLDDLIVRQMISPDDREKMATVLSDPNEMAKAAMQLARQIVPGHAAGVAFDPPSQSRKEASDPTDTAALEKAAEDAEWREIVRTGQC